MKNLSSLESCIKTDHGQLMKSGEFGITKGVNADREEIGPQVEPQDLQHQVTPIKPIIMINYIT